MKNVLLIFCCLICFTMSSCIKDNLFDTDEWWNGHWESVDSKDVYFSSGYKRQGGINFYFSSLDTVFKEISYGSLFDYSEKDRWKLILTYDGNYMKISEIEINKEIEVIGPAKSKEELGEFGVKYRYKDNFIHPLISDTLMYGY